MEVQVNNIIYLCGSSCSGKSTLGKLLREKLDWKEIVSYTTRQPRVGEVNHRDYNFVSVDEFQRLLPYMVEYEEVLPLTYYGSLLRDYKSNDFIILTPKMAVEMQSKMGGDIVFIDCNYDVLVDRINSNERNDNQRRIDRIDDEDEYFDKAEYVIDSTDLEGDEIFYEFKKIIDGIK